MTTLVRVTSTHADQTLVLAFRGRRLVDVQLEGARLTTLAARLDALFSWFGLDGATLHTTPLVDLATLKQWVGATPLPRGTELWVANGMAPYRSMLTYGDVFTHWSLGDAQWSYPDSMWLHVEQFGPRTLVYSWGR
jgi:hypothetical protein